MIKFVHYSLRQQTRRTKMKTLILTIATLLTSTAVFANSVSKKEYITKNERFIQIENVIKNDNGDISLDYSFSYSANTYPEARTLIKDAEGKLCLRQSSKNVTTVITRTKYITITEKQEDGTTTEKTVPVTSTSTAAMIAIAYYDEERVRILAQDIVSTNQVIDSENCVSLD